MNAVHQRTVFDTFWLLEVIISRENMLQHIKIAQFLFNSFIRTKRKKQYFNTLKWIRN